MNVISLGGSLGEYVLESALGMGGTAFVFRASHTGDLDPLGRGPGPFALKIASPRVDTSAFTDPPDGSRTRPGFDAEGVLFHTGSYACTRVEWQYAPEVLWREFAVLKDLDEPLLPRVSDFCHRDDVCYYTMEHIGGRTLRSVLAEEPAHVHRRWTGPVGELLASLADIRERHPSFFHGDVKPENIIVQPSGKLRLIDPALRRGPDAGGSQSSLGMTLTVAYNPLGLTGMEADTFSLAALAVELIVGRQPFAEITEPLMEYCCSGLHVGMSPGEKRQAIEAHLRLGELRDALPPDLRERLVDWLLKPRDYAGLMDEWPRLCGPASCSP